MGTKDDMQYVDSWCNIGSTNSRSIIRSVALDILSIMYAGSAKSISEVNRVHMIYLHHVFEDELDGFRKLLAWLQGEGVEFVSHTEAVNIITRKSYDKVYVTFSFDDGLKSCLRASRVLDEYGAKGCFFINAKMIGECDYAIVKRYCSKRLNMKPVEFMSWGDIEDIVKRGHEIGNHNYSHLDCGKLPLDSFVSEFEGNHELISRTVCKPKHFAWPYGRSCNIKQEQLDYVKRTGYKSAASAIRGCHQAKGSNNNFYLLRDHCVAAWPLRHIKYILAKSVVGYATS